MSMRWYVVHAYSGMEKAVEDITAELKKMSIKIKSTEEMAQVGTVASNGDREIGDMLAKAMEKVGKDGVITVDEGKSLATEVEWVEMRKHPGYGREMVGGIAQLTGASEVVFGHHERWDGAGYPRGLSGEQIPVGARIFAVVDTYDAMTSDRCYRKGLPHQVAIEEIRSLAGKQYDPGIVETFLKLDETEWRSVRNKFEDPALAVQAA